MVKCPAGQTPVAVSATDKNHQASFPTDVCGVCPQRQACPVQEPRRADSPVVRLQYDRARLKMHARRMKEKQRQFQNRYRWRAGIEGTMSRLKHTVGLATLRVRGHAAVKYKAFMAALGLNILRCAAV